VAFLLRVFSYLYHLGLCFALIVLSLISHFSGLPIKLEQLPDWARNGSQWLLLAALVGALTVFLAIRGKLRLLFFLWAVYVLVMVVRGYFFSTYAFSFGEGFSAALYLAGGAILACVGALAALRQRRTQGY
jgi:hypothetical protein